MNIRDNEESFKQSSADEMTDDSSSVAAAPPENDSSLKALIKEEQSYVRERLRKELGREPTQKEADEWLDAHTESY